MRKKYRVYIPVNRDGTDVLHWSYRLKEVQNYLKSEAILYISHADNAVELTQEGNTVPYLFIDIVPYLALTETHRLAMVRQITGLLGLPGTIILGE